MKRIILVSILICMLISAAILSHKLIMEEAAKESKASDGYIRDRVVMLKGDQGQCSGIEVRAPSGTVYILSATHCAEIAKKSKIVAITEKGEKFFVKIIAKNSPYDLLLLTATNQVEGIKVAEDIIAHEHIHTLTHGHGYPTYRTDGEFLEERIVNIPLYPVESREEEITCKATPGQMVVPYGSMFMVMPYCVMHHNVMFSTAPVLPSSSGGPVLNSKGALVGIVSILGGDGLSGLVPLRYIKEFLRFR